MKRRKSVPALLLHFAIVLLLLGPTADCGNSTSKKRKFEHVYTSKQPQQQQSAPAQPPQNKDATQLEPGKCISNPKLKTHYPETPQQVHLSLTDNPDEMSITWLTFEEVKTFVIYWLVEEKEEEALYKAKGGNREEKERREAERKRRERRVDADAYMHEYSDEIKDVPGCASADKSVVLTGNIRYIHTVTLTGLAYNQKYEYKVGHCKLSKPGDQGKEQCEIRKEHWYLAESENLHTKEHDKVFHFTTFPRHEDKHAFTIAVFGDMGLKKPSEYVNDQEATTWLFPDADVVTLPDSLEPHGMSSLLELVRGEDQHRDDREREHHALRTHLDTRSSGLKMQRVHLILHIGDIAYDMHEFRMKKKQDPDENEEDEVYNLGDRFMQVIEDVAAYVPYMVIAGNHENEERKAFYHTNKTPLSEKFDTQYEHFESRFNMPHNGRDRSSSTSQYYHFTYGPIWIVGVSTEYYYSYSVGEGDTFRWIPDMDKVEKQYKWVEHSLKAANENRHKTPFLLVVQHRPFYCTSKNPVTCKFNKMHKNGIPDEKTGRTLYGLEELFNRHFVDLVITGHEHTYEMFPPLELRDGRTRVLDDKYWWEVTREETHEDGVRRTHNFNAYTDPVAPLYLIVGRPGNAEEVEQLDPANKLQRVIGYSRFSYTLLHYPGPSVHKSLLAVRQVDVKDGQVPLEFVLEKSFARYEPEVLCLAVDSVLQKRHSDYHLALSAITLQRKQLKKSKYAHRRKTTMATPFIEIYDAPKSKRPKRVRRHAKSKRKTTPHVKDLIREMLYGLNRFGGGGSGYEFERARALLCTTENREAHRPKRPRTEQSPGGRAPLAGQRIGQRVKNGGGHRQSNGTFHKRVNAGDKRTSRRRNGGMLSPVGSVRRDYGHLGYKRPREVVDAQKERNQFRAHRQAPLRVDPAKVRELTAKAYSSARKYVREGNKWLPPAYERTQPQHKPRQERHNQQQKPAQKMQWVQEGHGKWVQKPV